MEKEIDIIIRDEGYYLTFIFNTYKSLKRFDEYQKQIGHCGVFDKRTYSFRAHPDYHVELIEWMNSVKLTSKLI